VILYRHRYRRSTVASAHIQNLEGASWACLALPVMLVLAACRPGLAPEVPGMDAAQADAAPAADKPRVSPYSSSAFVEPETGESAAKAGSESAGAEMEHGMDMDHDMSPESRS